MEYDTCHAAIGMITEIFDTETVKVGTAKTVPTCVAENRQPRAMPVE